jgi:hypothetical protein
MEVAGCIFEGNTAYYGGGLSCSGGDAVLNGCTFAGNSTVYSGEGGGILCRDSACVTIVNTILWGNASPVGPELWLGGVDPPAVDIDFSDVKGGLSSVFTGPGSVLEWGSHMLVSDPLFVDKSSGDYHLTYNSPCRGSGDNEAPGLPATDFEFDPRIAYGTVDMGADEFYNHLYVTGDTTPGGAIEGKFVGLPGTTPVGLFLGSGILPSPANTM